LKGAIGPLRYVSRRRLGPGFQQAHPHKHHAKPPADGDDSAPSSAPPPVASGSNQIDASV
jgi:hypothetical protein